MDGSFLLGNFFCRKDGWICKGREGKAGWVVRMEWNNG
jgi:hypothetical protein